MSENVVIKKDRTVTVPASEAKIGVQYDHNVNVITFDCPRYPDDDRSVDLSTMQIYINYMLPDKTLGSYLAENVKVDTNNPDTIHFDWKITRNVTQVKGALQALVCIKKVDAEGNELYHWNTDLIQSFRVGEGMECLETISSDYADVISQLLVNMNTVVGEFEALSADVTARTSEETLQGLVNNAASDEKLRTIVDTYMEEHPVGVNVDNTLSVSGDAADAKVTGDRISELKSDIEKSDGYLDDVGHMIIEKENIDLEWTDGGFYDKRNGKLNALDGWVYTSFVPLTDKRYIYCKGFVNAYGGYVIFLKNNSVLSIYPNESGYAAFEGVAKIPNGCDEIRFSILGSKEKELSYAKYHYELDVVATVENIKNNTETNEQYYANAIDGVQTGNGFLINGSYTEDANSITTDYVAVNEGDVFYVTSFALYATNCVSFFDANKKFVRAELKANSGNPYTREQVTVNSGEAFARFSCYQANNHDFSVETLEDLSIIKKVNSNTSRIEALEESKDINKGFGNILYGKKIAFCGDSFTEASNLGPEYYDSTLKCYKSFGYRIAMRNGMALYHDGKSGSTMHIVNTETPTERNPFAYQRYLNVPSDCDYIILQFGLNESSLASSDDTRGDKSSTDPTTMWGSWNTVLEYLIRNHPIARIGVIMSDAWMPQTYYTTLKEICEWWGIPMLDLGGDANVPLMNGGRRNGCGLTLNPVVAALRNATFYNADGDAHPNDAGHEWRSNVIEHWIRGL